MPRKVICSNSRRSEELACYGQSTLAYGAAHSVQWSPAAQARLRLLHRKVVVEFSDGSKPALLSDVFDWHSWWLSAFSPWAGDIRPSLVHGIGDKDEVLGLLKRLEDEVIQPCTQVNDDAAERPEQVLERMATVYCEFVGISPFQAGNEEMAELIMLLVCIRANWMKEVKLAQLMTMPEYKGALTKGFEDKNYKPMALLMGQCLIQVD